jgi:septum site-determining protein MinD
MGQVYVITSGKGGVGKTVTAFNIGVGLSLLGKSVVLIDADISFPNLDRVAGMEKEVKTLREIMELNGTRFNLEYLLEHTCLLQFITIKHKIFKGLSLIPAEVIGSNTGSLTWLMERLVGYLKEEYDYILIDCPSGIDEDFEIAVTAADNGVILTTPDIISVRNADTVAGKLEDYGIDENMLIINKMDIRTGKDRSMMDIKEILDILSVDLLGVIPEDYKISMYSEKGLSVAGNKKSKASPAYMNIVKRIIGDNVDFLEFDDDRTFAGRTIERLFFSLSAHLLTNRKVGI